MSHTRWKQLNDCWVTLVKLQRSRFSFSKTEYSNSQRAMCKMDGAIQFNYPPPPNLPGQFTQFCNTLLHNAVSGCSSRVLVGPENTVNSHHTFPSFSLAACTWWNIMLDPRPWQTIFTEAMMSQWWGHRSFLPVVYSGSSLSPGSQSIWP